jgi:hypothetical protein
MPASGLILQRFSVLHGLGAAKHMAPHLDPALVLAREIVEFADRRDDAFYKLVGYRFLGAVQVCMGQHRMALRTLQLAEQYRDPNRQKLLGYRFGYDPGLALLNWRRFALTILGLHSEGTRTAEQVRTEISGHGHDSTVANCMFFAVWPEFLFGDLEVCNRHATELSAYCTEKRMEQNRLLGLAIQASIAATREPTAENIETLRAAIDSVRRSGSNAHYSVFISHLGVALLKAGDAAKAETALRDGFAFVEQSGERYWLADLHRVDGKIALNCREPDLKRAEVCFLQAIEIACSQEARMLELRAATELARLWRDTGSPNDPRTLLEPILAGIEGGENLRDVRNARMLLAEIG